MTAGMQSELFCNQVVNISAREHVLKRSDWELNHNTDNQTVVISNIQFNYVCFLNANYVWNSPVITPLLLRYVRFVGLVVVAVLFFSPELLELCR